MNDKLKLYLGMLLIVFVGLTACQMIGCVWAGMWGGDILPKILALPYVRNLLVSAAIAALLYWIITGKRKKG